MSALGGKADMWESNPDSHNFRLWNAVIFHAAFVWSVRLS